MKTIFSLLLAVSFLLLTACRNNVRVAGAIDKDSTNKAQLTASAKADQNKQAAVSVVEAYNRHELEAAFKDFSPDFLDYGNGSSKPTNLADFKQFFKEFQSAFPDYKATIRRSVADGEWAMVWEDCAGTWKNEFMKQKATGKGFKVPDVDIFRFNGEGKIVEHYNIMDFNAVWKTIGLKM